MDTMKVLFASSGMVLTDGTHYGTAVYLAEDRAESDFYEITIEEYNRRIAEAEEGELTKADCLEALAMLGVE